MVAAIAADIARMIIIASLWRVVVRRLGWEATRFKVVFHPAGGDGPPCLTQVLWREQDLPTCSRQVGHGDRRLGLRRLLRGLRMKHAVAEPIVEIVAAALGLARRLLSFAFRAARLAHDAHMEMIVVPPPWA